MCLSREIALQLNDHLKEASKESEREVRGEEGIWDSDKNCMGTCDANNTSKRRRERNLFHDKRNSI